MYSILPSCVFLWVAALGASPVAAQTFETTSTRAPMIALPLEVDIAPAENASAEGLSMPADETATLNDEELDLLRGGDGVIVTNQTLVAVTAGNVLNGDFVAGAVTLTDNALQGFNGIGNLLINTGAQVSLQTGMNVTINLNQ